MRRANRTDDRNRDPLQCPTLSSPIFLVVGRSVEAIAPAVADIVLQQYILQHSGSACSRRQREGSAIDPAPLAEPPVIRENLIADRPRALGRLPQPRPVAGRHLDGQPPAALDLFRLDALTGQFRRVLV